MENWVTLATGRPAEEAREGTTEKGSDSDTREDKADPVTRGILDGRIYTAVGVGDLAEKL